MTKAGQIKREIAGSSRGGEEKSVPVSYEARVEPNRGGYYRSLGIVTLRPGSVQVR